MEKPDHSREEPSTFCRRRQRGRRNEANESWRYLINRLWGCILSECLDDRGWTFREHFTT